MQALTIKERSAPKKQDASGRLVVSFPTRPTHRICGKCLWHPDEKSLKFRWLDKIMAKVKVGDARKQKVEVGDVKHAFSDTPILGCLKSQNLPLLPELSSQFCSERETTCSPGACFGDPLPYFYTLSGLFLIIFRTCISSSSVGVLQPFWNVDPDRYPRFQIYVLPLLD